MIPTPHALKLIAHAREAGLPITAEHFLPVAEPVQ